MSITIPERYRKMRAGVSFDSVSLGYASIHLFPDAELASAQQGYGIVPEGSKTDWHDEWVVIGYEGTCGDPIFIDTDVDDYPVYTAAHGMGEWSPQLVAFTFRHFIQILQQVQILARGRANPVELQKRPVSDRESDAFIEFVRRDSPDVDFDFWRLIYRVET